MTLDECKRLLSFISAVSPSQKVTADTPDAWHQLLRDANYDHAYAATKRIATRERYVGVEAILGELNQATNRRPRPGEQGECPTHAGQWLTGCGCCRADRLVGESA